METDQLSIENLSNMGEQQKNQDNLLIDEQNTKELAQEQEIIRQDVAQEITNQQINYKIQEQEEKSNEKDEYEKPGKIEIGPQDQKLNDENFSFADNQPQKQDKNESMIGQDKDIMEVIEESDILKKIQDQDKMDDNQLKEQIIDKFENNEQKNIEEEQNSQILSKRNSVADRITSQYMKDINSNMDKLLTQEDEQLENNNNFNELNINDKIDNLLLDNEQPQQSGNQRIKKQNTISKIKNFFSEIPNKISDKSIQSGEIISQKIKVRQNSSYKQKEFEKQIQLDEDELNRGRLPENKSKSPQSKTSPPSIKSPEQKLLQQLEKKQKMEKQLFLLEQEINQLQQQKLHGAQVQKADANKKLKMRFEIQHDQQAQQQAYELVKKMSKIRKDHLQKQEDERHIQQEVMMKQILESRKHQEMYKQELVDKKRKDIQDRIEQTKIRKQMRDQNIMKQNEVIKELQAEQKLSKFQEFQAQQYDMPELERRKQELAEKRKLYKPLDPQELQEHARRHADELRMKRIQNEHKNIENLNQQNKFHPQKSKFTDKILQEEYEQKLKLVKEHNEKKQLLERRKKYGEIVQDLHRPDVSVKKDRSDKIQSKSIEGSIYEDKSQNAYFSQKPKNKKTVRYHLKKQEKESHEQSEQSTNPPAQNNYLKSTDKTQFKQSQISHITNSKTVQTDYLKQLRRMREQNFKNNPSPPKQDWQKYSQDPNLSLTDKYAYILQTAQKMENQAQMKQMTANKPQDQDQINEMYIESINAKLALLKQMN